MYNSFIGDGSSAFSYEGKHSAFANNAVSGYGQVRIGGEDSIVQQNTFTAPQGVALANSRLPLIREFADQFFRENPSADRNILPEAYINAQLEQRGEAWRIKALDHDRFTFSEIASLQRPAK